MILTKEAILAATDVPREEVEVPEWGGTVIVSGLTGCAREQIEETFGEEGGKRRTDNFMAKLAALSIVDESGHRIFEFEDAVLLGEKSATALERIADVAARLSGLLPQHMEKMAGNLPSGQSDSSSSDSPLPSDSPIPIS